MLGGVGFYIASLYIAHTYMLVCGELIKCSHLPPHPVSVYQDTE